MMKKQLILALIVLIGFQGCVKYYDLVPSEVPQASIKKLAHSHLTHSLRDVQFYREFSTEALFNVLWKSPTNGNLILDLYADRRGLSAQKKEAIFNKNQQLHGQWLMFFVLAHVKDNQRPDLNDPDATWTLYLKADDNTKIAPHKIKKMDMTPELATIFEKRNTNFKKLYFVKFPRTYTKTITEIVDVPKEELTEADITDQKTTKEITVQKTYDLYDQKNIQLVVNSVELEELVSWPVEVHKTGILDTHLTLTSYKESDSNEDCDWL